MTVDVAAPALPPPEDGRPSWDQVWLTVASAISLRSRCDRRQVGAVIVTRDNRVASVSYNGPPRNLVVQGSCSSWCERARNGDSGPAYDRCEMIHAEANALLRASWTEIQGGTIYVSAASCVNCARLVANAGLARLVHVVTSADLHRDPDTVESLLRTNGLSVQRATVTEA